MLLEHELHQPKKEQCWHFDPQSKKVCQTIRFENDLSIKPTLKCFHSYVHRKRSFSTHHKNCTNRSCILLKSFTPMAKMNWTSSYLPSGSSIHVLSLLSIWKKQMEDWKGVNYLFLAHADTCWGCRSNHNLPHGRWTVYPLIHNPPPTHTLFFLISDTHRYGSFMSLKKFTETLHMWIQSILKQYLAFRQQRFFVFVCLFLKISEFVCVYFWFFSSLQLMHVKTQSC